MKSLIIAAVAVAGAAVAAPAFAQDAAPATPTIMSPQPYVNLGYTGTSPNGHDIGEITGRFGAKMGKYWGVEGEYGHGIGDKRYVGAAGTSIKVQELSAPAAYGVVYFPLFGDKLEILGRGGYGTSALKYDLPTRNVIQTSHSWNYGAGAQYFFNHKDGIRIDYTRRDFQEKVTAPRDDDTWTASYVHRF